MKKIWWRVGELAKKTGLSVRTLHYYDEIGLLSPKHHSNKGYRLYSNDEVIQLHQIQMLKQLGFPLEKIQQLLNHPDNSLLKVIEWHLQYLEEQINQKQQIHKRLQAIANRLARQEQVSLESLIETLEAINMFEKYFTKEQLEDLEARRTSIGDERLKAVSQAWPDLISKVRKEMEKGTDPLDPSVLTLAESWMGLIREFTGGNAQHAQSLQNMYQQEQSVATQTGLDPQLIAYIGKAITYKKG